MRSVNFFFNSYRVGMLANIRTWVERSRQLETCVYIFSTMLIWMSMERVLDSLSIISMILAVPGQFFRAFWNFVQLWLYGTATPFLDSSSPIIIPTQLEPHNWPNNKDGKSSWWYLKVSEKTNDPYSSVSLSWRSVIRILRSHFISFEWLKFWDLSDCICSDTRTD